MSFASCSSSCSLAIRSAVRTTKSSGTAMNIANRASSSRHAAQICRNYATTTESTPTDTSPPSSAHTPSSSNPGDGPSATIPPAKPSLKSDRPRWRFNPDQSSYNDPQYRGSSNLTGPKAQEYLSKLLRLPAAHTFSEKLALQILTHKSYRYNHIPRHVSLSPPPTPAEMDAQYAAHNARLSFIGRRALATYLTMFLHASAATHGTTIAGMGLLLPGENLAVKVNNLMHVGNVGRAVGIRWGMDKIARWDGNPNTDGLRILGTTVQAIVGAVYTEFGSPAAHRLFHLYYLPLMAWQLRDPALIERVEVLRKDLDDQLGGGILLPERTAA